MFNVLDRLEKLKRNYPEKYERICNRLDDIRRSASCGYAVGGDSDGTTVEEYIHLASIRKLTDDFFSRLATVDRNNEDFWRHIGSWWVGRTEIDDLPQPDTRDAVKRQDEEELIRTIVLSHHPKESFKLMLEYNHPQRILNKLLLNHDRKNLLFGIRTKFGLPLATYLTPKQNLQTRGSLINDIFDSSKGTLQSQTVPAVISQEAIHEEALVTALQLPHLTPPEIIVPEGDNLDGLLVESVLYVSPNLLGQESPAETKTGTPTGSIADNTPTKRVAEDVKDTPTQKTTDSSPTPDVIKGIGGGPGGKVAFEVASNGNEPVYEGNEDDDSSNSTDSASSKGSAQLADDGAGGMDQFRLQRLKIIFEESDTDDEPGLDINEFKQAMKKILGEDVPEREIELIFMKVDANCDGNVDWAEFLEFTLREFQERDAMTQLTKDAFFEKAPQTVPGTRNQREIKAMIFVHQQGFGKAAQDLTNGRYYSMNSEGNVICWTTDFKKIASFDLIPDARGTNNYIRANDMCAMPEIKAVVVSFTSSELHFYNYDDVKLDLCFSIVSLKSPILCLYYYFQESESILLMGDQAGKVGVIRFKGLHYDGLWGSLGLPHSNNPKVTWIFLTKHGKACSLKGVLGTDWINQVKFFPTLNAIIACSLDPRCSMCVVPFRKQREPVYFSQMDGFNCFDYSDFLNVIVTGSKNRSIQLWNQDNVENPTGHFDGHEGAINRVACYRDVEFTVLISVDAHHVVKVWDFKDQACLQSYDSKGFMLPHHATSFMYYNNTLEHLVYGARDVVMLKRVNLHRKGPVELFQKTHDEPIVGALYNDLFECVVTACQASSIMVWNFQTGDKIIQYRNAHTVVQNGKIVQVPIKSMSFDANKRRLITCGSDGLIKLWNFNNGACLSFFDQLEGVDLNVVRYQKNRDLVVVAGWNQHVFMVRDTRGEDDVDETVYEWEKTHRSDITTLEIIYAPEDNPFKLEDLTSPEDIRKPDIAVEPNSSYIAVHIKRKRVDNLKEDALIEGTKSDADLAAERTSSSNTAQIDESPDTSGKSLPFGETVLAKGEKSSEEIVKERKSDGVVGKSETGSGSSSASDTGSGDATGGDDSGDSNEEEDKESDGPDECLADDHSYIVSGSSDGELIIWHLFSGKPICFLNTDGCPFALSRKARADYAARTVNDYPKLEIKDSGSIEHFLGLQMVQHQKGSDLPELFSPLKDDAITVPRVVQQARHCITCILVLQNRVFNDGNTASIVTASTDGFVRAWSIPYAAGGLLGIFYAAHEFDSFITTMYTDEKNELLFTGDTRGYVKIWLLCEWMQAPEHLKDHRHCFDPRNFPFMKRHKIFAALVAFRSNYMMRKTVDNLEPSQRGLYQQPYILNSFRGHLQRVTQIQVVYHKKIIISASEDCSVRLWHFSGLFIGTLGQDVAFHNDTVVESPAAELISHAKPNQSSVSNVNSLVEVSRSQGLGRQDSENQISVVPEEDNTFLHEDEDPNEVLLKPKVIIPADLVEKGSVATLQVLYSDRHKRTKIPAYIETADDKLSAAEKVASDICFDNREDYIEALQELTVRKNRFEYKPFPFKYHDYDPPYEVKDAEALIFTHAPLQEMEPMGTLDRVIPKNLFEYNLSKVQNALLECLSVEQRKPFLDLQLTSELDGPALDELRNLVKAREAGLAPVKPAQETKIRPDMWARATENSAASKRKAKDIRSAKSVGPDVEGRSIFHRKKLSVGSAGKQKLLPGKGLRGGKDDGFRNLVQKALTWNKKLGDAERPVTSVSVPLRAPLDLPEKLNCSSQRLAPSPSFDDLNDDEPSPRSRTNLAGQRSTTGSRGGSAFVPRLSSSQSSDVLLNEYFLNADRIEIVRLRKSEDEFIKDIILEQKRNAKFEYLSLLERDNARLSQIDPYLPLVKNDAELYSEIRPVIEPGMKYHQPSTRPKVKKVCLKTVNSVSSMDRIQRVFKMADFDAATRAAPRDIKVKRKELDLTVPPLPRRLASVIKGRVRNGKRAESSFNFDEEDEPNSALSGKKLWGDQESLAIFDQNGPSMLNKSVSPLEATLNGDHVNMQTVDRGRKKKTDLIDALQSRRGRQLLQQQPLTNRYIYHQLSDSILPEPTPQESDPAERLVDVTVFLTEHKAIKDGDTATKKEDRRLNEELNQTQRKSVGFSKARVVAATKNVETHASFPRNIPDSSLHELTKMMDQMQKVEADYIQSQKS